MARQYVVVKFAKGPLTYTYHNDGEPVRAGDKVEVPGTRGGGCKLATVTHTHDMKPRHFETKAILGVAPREGEASA